MGSINRVINGVNDLQTWCLFNGDYGQQLISEWTGECDNGKHYNMSDVAWSTRRKRMKWRCNKGHEWYAAISNRTYGKECSYCKGKKVTNENCLYNWCLHNKEFGKQLLNEWTGIAENGEQLSIQDISFGSGKKMLWKCSNGHTWKTTITHRTYEHTACPLCRKDSTSYPEQFLYRALKQIYPQTISRGKLHGFEIDIAIPEERTCIEYSGSSWHFNKLNRDKLKEQLCKNLNIRLIQIYGCYNGIETDIFENDFMMYQVSKNKDTQDYQLIMILDNILKSFNHSISEIDTEKAQKEAFEFMHKTKI